MNRLLNASQSCNLFCSFDQENAKVANKGLLQWLSSCHLSLLREVKSLNPGVCVGNNSVLV